MIADIPLDGDHADRRNVDIPAVKVVPLGKGMHDASVDGVAVHELNLREPDPLFEPRRGPDPRHHHELDQLLGFQGEFSPLRLLEAVLGRGDVLGRKRLQELRAQDMLATANASRMLGCAGLTYHLKLVLPELLLPRLIEERKVAHMVDEDVPEDGQLGVEGGDLPKVGLERGAEPAQGSRGVELGDLVLDLFGQELSFEV